MYAVMTIGIPISYFALLTPHLLCIVCIVVNSYMIKINTIYFVSSNRAGNGRALYTILNYTCKICGTNVCVSE